MVELFGAGLFVTATVYWIAIAGVRTQTLIQSSASLVIYGGLNFGLFWAFGLIEDQETYYNYGVQLANVLEVDLTAGDSRFTPGKESYIWLLAILFVIFGQSPIPALALNIFFMVSLPALFVWAGRNFGLISSGRVTGWLLALSPPLLLWGHGLNREPLVFFLLGVLLVGFSWILQRRFLWGFFALAGVGLAMSVTRSSLLAVVVAGGLAFSALSLLQSRTYSSLESLGYVEKLYKFLALVPMMLFVPTVGALLIILESDSWRSFGAGIPDLSHPGQATAIPGASWEHNSSLVGFLGNIGKFFFGPMPWEVANLSMLFFAAEGLGYLAFTLMVLLAISKMKRIRQVGSALLLSALPVVVAGTLLLANYGLNSRIRAHVFVLMVVLAEPVIVSWNVAVRKYLMSKGSPPARARGR